MRRSSRSDRRRHHQHQSWGLAVDESEIRPQCVMISAAFFEKDSPPPWGRLFESRKRHHPFDTWERTADASRMPKTVFADCAPVPRSFPGPRSRERGGARIDL